MRISKRLNDSPSCLVADENDPTSQMQEIMKSMGQPNLPDIKPIFEINPKNKIVKKLQNMKRGKTFDDISLLLFEQALIQEGGKLDNPADFVRRLNSVMEKSL